MWLSTALPPSPDTAAVGDECSQQGSSRERYQEDGDRHAHGSTNTETSWGRFWDRVGSGGLQICEGMCRYA